MASKLYVGGIPYEFEEADMEKAFAEYGKVESAVVIKDKFSGRSKGFGFVEMSTAEEAEAAIKALDQQEMGGRKITVNHARPMKPRE